MSTATNGPDENVQAQREALAATVGALAEKADVPARIQSEVSRDVERVKQQPAAAAAAALGLVMAFVLFVRRRKQRSRSDSGN